MFNLQDLQILLGNVYRDRSIRWASENGHHAAVKYLVSQGVDIQNLTQEQQEYILFCQKIQEKIRLRAQKTIYYWWIQICYDPTTKVGRRMVEKSWIEFDKIQNNNDWIEEDDKYRIIEDYWMIFQNELKTTGR
jgi:hypothetical protein